MNLTLEELKLRLAQEFDEVTLLEMLNINAELIVEAFSDIIEENYDELITKVEEVEEEPND